MKLRGLVFLSLALFGAGCSWQPSSDGQLLFLPIADLGAASAESIVGLELERCRETRGGLEVRGRVIPPGPGVTEVMVTGGTELMPGLRVGASNLSHAGRDGGPGSFEILIPWADRDSSFALVVPGDPHPGADAEHGAATRCPR